jgi:hypothetical protein
VAATITEFPKLRLVSGASNGGNHGGPALASSLVPPYEAGSRSLGLDTALINRRRSWGRRAMACPDVGRALPSVFFGCGIYLPRHASFDCFAEEALQVAATPTTSGAGPKTFAELAGAPRFFHPQEIDNLALADVETEADFVVELHFEPCTAPSMTGKERAKNNFHACYARASGTRQRPGRSSLVHGTKAQRCHYITGRLTPPARQHGLYEVIFLRT